MRKDDRKDSDFENKSLKNLGHVVCDLIPVPAS